MTPLNKARARLKKIANSLDKLHRTQIESITIKHFVDDNHDDALKFSVNCTDDCRLEYRETVKVIMKRDRKEFHTTVFNEFDKLLKG